MTNTSFAFGATTIAKADALLLSIPFQAAGLVPWNLGGPPPEKRFDLLLIRLETSDGLVGWGEAFSRNRDRSLRDMIQRKVLDLTIGRNPFEISKIKSDIEYQLHNLGRCGPLMYGIGAVDTALWDLLGKVSGVPLAELIGGRFTSSIDVYASLMRVGDADVIRDVIRDVVERGYKSVKLHDLDPHVIRAAVEAAGEGISFSLDVNCPWSTSEALRMDRELADLGLTWLEEPVWPPENYAGLVRLRAEGSHRIASGENAGSYFDFVAMARAGAIDIAQPDIAKVGGVTEFRRIGNLCDAYGIEMIPHGAIFGPGLLATAHFNASRQDTPVLERLFVDFEAELYGETLVPVGGQVTVPVTPGLGRDPDPDVLSEYQLCERD